MIGKLSLLRVSKPEENGYNDKLTVYTDGGIFLMNFRARGWPNPHHPVTLVTCRKAYGAVADGNYTWNTAWNPLKGRFLQINGGGIVPSAWPNVTHKWGLWCEKTAIHKGWAAWWPGSAACIVIHPKEYPDFISLFKEKMMGPLEIITPLNGGKP
jgi:hypothetical protein